MKKWLSFSAVVFLTIFSLPGISQAHSLWIEKDGDGSLSVCFGEFAEGLREKTGEKLDKIAHLEAWSLDDGKRVPLSAGKTKDRLVLNAKEGAVIVQEAGLEIRAAGAKEGMAPAADAKVTKSFLYARFAGSTKGTLKPELPLDILPSPEDAGKIQVFFEGKPAADKKVDVTAANGWRKTFKTDAEGRAVLDLPWTGLYVADVSHVAEKAGNFGGKNYDAERHHTALSIEKI